ncbi:MAG: NTP transferase domain-containing protein [Cyclobacteriaceae bacterium]
MSKKPALVVMAAGMGSRYGSLKQLDTFGPNGETIVDYAIYDAIAAGFEKVVFVIRRNIEQEFKEVFVSKLSDHIEIAYVFQELDVLPTGYSVPEGRVKPWGTAHAVLTAAQKINEPFAIINADDFYGRSSLVTLYQHLSQLDNQHLDACLVGFLLENTLSDHGSVARGICEVSSNHILNGITERTSIHRNAGGGAFYEEDEQRFDLSGRETVSMNLMGFTSPVFELMKEMFVEFIESQGTELKSEFFIPSVLDKVRELGVEIPVILSEEEWFGVTYKEDKPIAKARISEMINKGAYPQKLWV